MPHASQVYVCEAVRRCRESGPRRNKTERRRLRLCEKRVKRYYDEWECGSCLRRSFLTSGQCRTRECRKQRDDKDVIIRYSQVWKQRDARVARQDIAIRCNHGTEAAAAPVRPVYAHPLKETRLEGWKHYAPAGCTGQLLLAPHVTAWAPAFRQEHGVTMWVECLGRNTSNKHALDDRRDVQLSVVEKELGRRRQDFFLQWCHSVPPEVQKPECAMWERVWRELERGGSVVFYCVESKHRSPATLARFLMTTLGITFVVARRIIGEHPGTCIDFYTKLNGLVNTVPKRTMPKAANMSRKRPPSDANASSQNVTDLGPQATKRTKTMSSAVSSGQLLKMTTAEAELEDTCVVCMGAEAAGFPRELLTDMFQQRFLCQQKLATAEDAMSGSMSQLRAHAKSMQAAGNIAIAAEHELQETLRAAIRRRQEAQAVAQLAEEKLNAAERAVAKHEECHATELLEATTTLLSQLKPGSLTAPQRAVLHELLG